MRRKLAEIKDTLVEFIEQRDHLLLVIRAADAEMTYVLKTIEGLDQSDPANLFLVFAEPFTHATKYASAIMKNLRAQMEVARARQKGRGEKLYPQFPARCDDEHEAPTARLRAAIDHVSSIASTHGWQTVLWGFLPVQISDREGYARLVGEFVPWKGFELWMKGLRVMTRDDRADPFLFPALRSKLAPGVLLYEMDMSPAALNDALVREAADKRLSTADRMQALMQLASLDHAYKRYPEAIRKYKRLYDFYAEHRVPVMQALSLQGVGDALRCQGDARGAKSKYQQALTLAMQAQALPVLFQLSVTLGDLALELDDAHEAEGFFAAAVKIAETTLNPFGKAEALEKQGIARARQGDVFGAVPLWKDAEALANHFADHERRRSVLTRLMEAYRGMFLDAERRACEAELELTKKAIKNAVRADHDHPLKQVRP